MNVVTVAGLLCLTVLWSTTLAASVVFKNQCSYSIDVYDTDSTCTLVSGSKDQPTFGCNREIPGKKMYRHGSDPEATLAEFSQDGGKAWFDLSIIPPGPGDCSGYANCRSMTGKSGFNVPVMIFPTKHLGDTGYRCQSVICQFDGCPDAFHFPSDNDKVYNCPLDEEFHSFLAATAVLAATALAVANAAVAIFKNQCPHAIEVYDNKGSCWVGAGSMQDPKWGCWREIPRGSTMYRHGANPHATLAEFSIANDGKVWYDISIIPPGSNGCTSLQTCKDQTHGNGFNVGMMILPNKHRGQGGVRCNTLMCQWDGCPDAYHFPSDNSKVFNCPIDEEFHVIFCP
ncbi:TPA: LOW QUALITY PROTEIN: hypothetical protein N0F65_003327 [Lagenidium giganteum]|uniref:Thaumatin-like protein n=1 Tax=Lagenidium giganteum TaxID=4803 RepID=A0AAV2ZEZ1_9STRA|nr:TPA: LOW QUALITY PROTEIN: hypothetical protein N0F65_003327 [Lagenidium giganteum]